ncbi:choline dehydrogenase [Candidatus Viadribacter manganicus]|uniref:Choline dehydrogenase n=1 Tax=Candidatus Viadribacter manganicus TaxID=1759059 RepID=A0A1B1AM72_9PROT|nr:choline dehydrogenase [Candidatus Viadribacter manganicus]ANP47653.1 choline dehydrogenase [Candidatus Viadribacter manganicus]
MADTGDRFDYVIVGAGSAGCVLANRLSEDPNVTVAVLEAGGKNESLLVKMPAGVGNLIAQKGVSNWGFETTPQQFMDGRKLYQPRGRGWGGSSAINGMIYIRGHARDYDQWRQMGLSGWGYADVLPYFKRAQHHEDGADAWNGEAGPLWVSRGPPGHPIYKAFIQAGAQAGYPVTRDFNGHQQEGVGPYHLTIRDGERWSASAAYLRPIIERPNLKVISGAYAHRILIENKKALGVEFSAGPGKLAQNVYAKREVLVCGGAFQSPQLLQLSGIGPGAELQKHGINVVHDAPDVGRNLQDHLDVCVIFEMTKPLSMYSLTKGLKQPMIGIEYMLTKQGLGRTNHLHAGAFLKTRGELDRPDIQIHLVNAQMRDHARVKPDRDAFTLHACQLRPESKGTVTLTSTNPFDTPAIDPRYLAEENDRRTMRDSVRIVRDIVKQHALDLYRGPEFAPGEHIRTDSEIDAWIRQTGETIYHPVGTVRMGADAKAPLDEQLRVRGVENLRVIDASVMPTLIGGNTNAPTIMIAEKISDALRGKSFLPPQDAPIAEDERVAV